MNPIIKLLGFDFIKNKKIKNAARLLANVGLVLAAGTPQGAAILAALGISGSAEAQGLVTGALAIIEALRTHIKETQAEK